MSLNNFQIRKFVFDYLNFYLNNQTITAILATEHPASNAVFNDTPLIVVSIIRDAASGLYINSDLAIRNPEIQLMYYASKELTLTKPTGLCEQINELMLDIPIIDNNNNKINFHKISDRFIGYVSQIQLYVAYTVWRFYTGEL